MTLDEFRQQMTSYRQSADDEAKSFKDPYIALDRLRALYSNFDCAEKQMANRVLAEWVLSDDEGVRFDALALINEFKIRSTIPDLKKLSMRLVSSSIPSAPYELKKVISVIKGLGN